MGGIKGSGKGGGSPDYQINPFAAVASGMANETYAQTRPLRKAMIEDYGSFIRPGGYGPSTVLDYFQSPPPLPGQQAVGQTGGYAGTAGSNLGIGGGRYNPYNLPGYAPLYQLARGGVESQYNQARANILGSSPRGGALGENLSNLEMSRAQTAGSLPAQIASPLIQNIMGQAYQTAFGTPAQAQSALGSAASAQSQQYASDLGYQAQQAARASQSMLGLGAGLGSLLSLGFKAPAEGSIFGSIFG